MLRKYLASAASNARRTVPAFGLAAAVLASTLGPAIPAAAQAPVVHDHRNGAPPVARVQVIVQWMKIIDDRDGTFAGDGEFDFYFQLTCFQVSVPCLGGYGSAGLDGIGRSFSAGSGETVPFNRFLPEATHLNRDDDASIEGGYPMREGHRYTLNFGMQEKDQLTSWEQMGRGEVELTAENGWGIGSHSIRSTQNNGSPGDYILNFEVKRVVLPDLRPVNITVTDIAGSTKKRVCTAVQNIEPGQAGQFIVDLQLDGKYLPEARATSLGLTPGNATEVCGEVELPAGQHQLVAVVDPLNAMLEFNEANNTYEQSATIAQTSPAQSTTADPTEASKDTDGQPSKNPQGQAPTGNQGPKTPANTGVVPSTNQSQTPTGNQEQNKKLADLTVRAIKLNGQAPDGNTDCKEGKNGIVAVVKNTGAGKSEGFTARLVIDGADGAAIEQQVNGMDAGQEREVRFGDVQMKKGAHTLVVAVDPDNTVAESNQDNNRLSVTAKCG